MTLDDIKKLKYAIVLTFIGVLANASSKLDIRHIVESIGISLVISIPLLVVYNIINNKLDRLSIGFKRGIAMLSIPIGLLIWRWLHSTSIFYETVSMFVLIYLLIATIWINRKSVQKQ